MNLNSTMFLFPKDADGNNTVPLFPNVDTIFFGDNCDSETIHYLLNKILFPNVQNIFILNSNLMWQTMNIFKGTNRYVVNMRPNLGQDASQFGVAPITLQKYQKYFSQYEIEELNLFLPNSNIDVKSESVTNDSITKIKYRL